MNAFHLFIRGSLAVACLTGFPALGGLQKSVSLTTSFEPLAVAPPPDAASSPAADRFHLGTAAGPFGWSSVIADFDADGRPDFAIADRVAISEAGSYRYRLLFAVAGRQSRSISFDSPSPAVTVAVEDIDNDDDLDVLVTYAPSSIVETVWLNDGHGRFVPGDDSTLPGTRFAESSVNPEADESSSTTAVRDARPVLDPVLSVFERLPETGLAAGFRRSAIPSSSAATASSRAPPNDQIRSI